MSACLTLFHTAIPLAPIMKRNRSRPRISTQLAWHANNNAHFLTLMGKSINLLRTGIIEVADKLFSVLL